MIGQSYLEMGNKFIIPGGGKKFGWNEFLHQSQVYSEQKV